MGKRKKDQSRKGGRRKKGRNLIKCARYRNENRREKNKERRAKRIAKGFRHVAASLGTDS